MKRQTIATSYGAEIARLAALVELDCHVAVVEGPSMGAACAIGSRPIVIGAAPGCDIRLEDDRVSARHAEVFRDGPAFRVRDLGSTNGILYEGALMRELELPLGGTFTIGHTPLRLQPTPRLSALAPATADRFGELVGQSLIMRELFALLELSAASDVTLLVEGETGTGKELVARSVHAESGRRKAPFVAIDCGALPETLLESALFGHVKGAFTGADQARQGAFVQAHGGTLFLDEVTNLSLAAQARLLRVLENRQVRAVGSDREHAVDVRVVAAANADIDALVRAGRFRADLFYRLAVVRVRLPSLKARREDIPLLVGTMLAQRGLEPQPIGGPELEWLLAHGWPGNVRELRNAVERAIALSPGARRFSELRWAFLPSAAAPPTAEGARPAPSVQTEAPFAAARNAVLDGFERTYLAALVQRYPDNLSAMARAAHLDRKTLRALLAKHHLTIPRAGG